MKELVFLLAALLAALAACQASPPPPTTGAPTLGPAAEPPGEPAPAEAPAEPTATAPATPAPLEPPLGPAYAYTYVRPDGNRYLAGAGHLPQIAPLDIPLAGAPRWVVGLPVATGVLWAVVLEDGRVQAFTVGQGQVTPAAIQPDQVGSLPPVLAWERGEARLLLPPLADLGQIPPLVVVPGGGQDAGIWAYVHPEQGLVLMEEREPRAEGTVPLTPLPDARLLTDGQGRILLLTDPTGRYGHGVVGDSLEAGSITLIDSNVAPPAVRVFPIPEPRVVEGIAPIWADLDGDGRREIIVTLSDSGNGAQIVVYDESGAQVAAGPAIGRGGRWRHQIAVAPFGPGGELELVDVLTPHIGGVVEFYRWQGETLAIVAQQGGFTSHVIGTNNLDMAVAADFDGDGRVELLLPAQERTVLGAIGRSGNGAEVAWSLPLEGVMVTNLGVVSLPGGGLAVAVGREDGVLRLWQE